MIPSSLNEHIYITNFDKAVLAGVFFTLIILPATENINRYKLYIPRYIKITVVIVAAINLMISIVPKLYVYNCENGRGNIKKNNRNRNAWRLSVYFFIKVYLYQVFYFNNAMFPGVTGSDSQPFLL